MDSTQIFTASRKVKGGRVLRTAYHVTSVPHELTDSEKGSRWMAEFGAAITKVERVKIGSHTFLTDEPVDWASPYIIWDTYTVITTTWGQCCIVEFQDGYHEVQGIVFSTLATLGRKMECRTLGTWRKYGQKRGHGMKWLRMMAAAGQCKSPESGRDICPAEAYDRMGGGTKFNAA